MSTPPTPPPMSEQPRLLRRSRHDKVIGGVCGGLGRYLGVDPVLLRIAFVVLAVAGGGGIVLYVVAWILMPKEGEGDTSLEARAGHAEPGSRPENADTARLIVGGALIAVGTILLLNLAIPRLGRYAWPLALIVIGVAIVVQTSARS